VQFVFELRLPWAATDILDQLEGNYGDLSVQKYSSTVVEKCLKYAGEVRRTRIIRELINNSRLDQVMQDPFGNYVIQAALQQSKVCILIFNKHFGFNKIMCWTVLPLRKDFQVSFTFGLFILVFPGVSFGDSLIF
jgi:hypothetical protein